MSSNTFTLSKHKEKEDVLWYIESGSMSHLAWL